MSNNYYKTMVDYIHTNFDKRQQVKLIRYFNSELFQAELFSLMEKQSNAGESLTKEMASECLLDSHIDREHDEDLAIIRWN